MLCKTIETAQSEGQVRNDLPAALLATQIIATIEGGIMLSRLYKDERPMRECLDMLRCNLQLNYP
jgi:TetR/AcrR family transcriptional repressor of nem operon